MDLDRTLKINNIVPEYALKIKSLREAKCR
jgi:hypothetical protein